MLFDLSYGVQGARAGPLPRCSITTDGRQVDLDDFENTPGLPSEIDEQPLELDEPSGYLEPSAGYLNPPSIRHESHARRQPARAEPSGDVEGVFCQTGFG